MMEQNIGWRVSLRRFWIIPDGKNFTKVIDKAIIACNNSGREVAYDFREVTKIVEAGATSKPIRDYEISR